MRRSISCTKEMPDPTPMKSNRNIRLARRLACMAYDSMLLIAIFFFATMPLVMMAGSDLGANNPFFFLYLLTITLLYFCWFWTHGGQTLGMKTWKISIYSDAGDAVTLIQALSRFVLALLGLSLAGLGFWWALVDRDGLTLHDRISGTRLLMVGN